jgi:hypothetical protein
MRNIRVRVRDLIMAKWRVQIVTDVFARLRKKNSRRPWRVLWGPYVISEARAVSYL